MLHLRSCSGSADMRSEPFSNAWSPYVLWCLSNAVGTARTESELSEFVGVSVFNCVVLSKPLNPGPALCHLLLRAVQLGYLRSWSAYATYLKEHPDLPDPLIEFKQRLLGALNAAVGHASTAAVLQPSTAVWTHKCTSSACFYPQLTATDITLNS